MKQIQGFVIVRGGPDFRQVEYLTNEGDWIKWEPVSEGSWTLGNTYFEENQQKAQRHASFNLGKIKQEYRWR